MQKTIENIADVAGYLWQKGWAERNGGNLTVNITNVAGGNLMHADPLVARLPIGKKLDALPGNLFYVKATGMRMRDLAKKPMHNGVIIRICNDAEHYDIIDRKPLMPTSELPSHLELHNYLLSLGSVCTATLHTHPIELVAMSHQQRFLDGKVLTQLLWSMIPETLAFAPRGIGVVPYALPGSQILADATLQEVRKHDVVLWEKHGVFSVGRDIIEAFDQIDVLNKAAQIYMASCAMGQAPEGMKPEAITEIQKVFNLPKCEW